jgi:hypothetical protein
MRAARIVTLEAVERGRRVGCDTIERPELAFENQQTPREQARAGPGLEMRKHPDAARQCGARQRTLRVTPRQIFVAARGQLELGGEIVLSAALKQRIVGERAVGIEGDDSVEGAGGLRMLTGAPEFDRAIVKFRNIAGVVARDDQTRNQGDGGFLSRLFRRRPARGTSAGEQ